VTCQSEAQREQLEKQVNDMIFNVADAIQEAELGLEGGV